MIVNGTSSWIDAGAASSIGNRKLSAHPETLQLNLGLGGQMSHDGRKRSIHPSSIIHRTRVRALLPPVTPHRGTRFRATAHTCDRPRGPSRITHVEYAHRILTPYTIRIVSRNTGMSTGQPRPSRHLYTESMESMGGPRARRAGTGHLPPPAPGSDAWTRSMDRSGVVL